MEGTGARGCSVRQQDAEKCQECFDPSTRLRAAELSMSGVLQRVQSYVRSSWARRRTPRDFWAAYESALFTVGEKRCRVFVRWASLV